MQIDELYLNIGRVVVKDYSKSDQPTPSVHEIHLKNKIFKNITSPQQLVTIVLFQALGPAGIKSAGIYAAASVLGVAFLPAGVAGVLLGNDSATAEYKKSSDTVYKIVKDVLNGLGAKIAQDNKEAGIIKADAEGHSLTIKIEKGENNKTKLDISARKMMIPKPEYAGGVLYKISEKLK